MSSRIKSIIFIFLVFFAASFGLVLFKSGGNQAAAFKLKKNDTAALTIRSPRSVIFESQIKTSELREKVKTEVQRVYKIDQSAYARQEGIIKNSFQNLKELKNNQNLSVDQKKDKISTLFKVSFEKNEAVLLINKNNADFDVLTEEVVSLILDLHKKESITEENFAEVKKQIGSSVKTNFASADQKVIIKLAQCLLITNSLFDEKETLAREEEASKKVSPVFYQLKKDEIILAKSDKVDDLALEKLQAAGLLSPSFAWQEKVGTFLFLTIISFLFFFYLQKFSSFKNFVNVGIIILGALCLLVFWQSYLLPVKPILVYLLPLAAVVVIVEKLADLKVATLAAVYLSVAAAIFLGNLLDVLIIHLVISIFVLWYLRGMERFSDLLKSTFLVALLDFSLMLAFHFLAGTLTLSKAGQLGLVSLALALEISLLVIGGLALAGYLFKIAVFPNLLELGNPSSTLMRELSVRAPGTYHHSIIVGSLVERAAKKVGGQVLLAKVGAYYHDIGKLKNPELYIENRNDGRKKVADPVKDAHKVMAHVGDGLEIGRRYRLPKEILDIIAEHHGTSVAIYFYNLASNDKADDFRYHGPKPQSKEAAVIMLADSFEAYVRSKKNEKDFSLERAATKIIFDKLNDRQLDATPLTLRELEAIKKVFVEVMGGIYHERLKYEEKL